MPRFGAVIVAAVHQRRKSEDADQAAPGAFADQRAELQLAEHPRQQVAAGAGGLVDHHHLRALNRRQRRLQVGAVAHGPVADHRTAEDVDVVVGHAAAAVVALVDDDRLAVGLREEVALEVGVAGAGGVRHIDVRDAPVRRLGDLAQVAFDPVAIAQVRLVFDRHDLDDARAAAVGVRSDRQLDDASRGLLEAAVEILGILEIVAVDGEQILPCFDVDARLGQRRAQLRIPIEAAEDFREAIAAVFDFVVGAEEAARNRLRRRRANRRRRGGGGRRKARRTSTSSRG